jgi:spore germination protein YaaH
MTYDFSSSTGQAGPNSPVPWMEHALQTLLSADASFATDPTVTGKVLLGLPFYGHDYTKKEVRRSRFDNY